ncbi:MAG TPA: NAD(P)H-dependent glycerol-3-phosphate dehydrogenase [Holophagaceae bacterium]|jgi:glycerol-3-phosphate dehydrogenase (NAD(P)+)|nr:NAD(P)H-dependent glycerol-3-phosphate dehydrogenase [Holophagaceae bacterium]
MPEFDLAVFGAGSWGTALACGWGLGGRKVALWGRGPEKMAELARTRLHPRLNGTELPAGVLPLSDPAAALAAPMWVSCLPVQATPGAWKMLATAASRKPPLLLHSSKGVLQESHLTISQALEPQLGLPVGVLSGPTFADEVARGLPSAIVLALPETVNEATAAELQHFLATERLRVYRSRDVVGAELCGALKNVLAIAAGLVEGLGLGHNARAALITRGLAEMARLVDALGGQRETVMGLAGMGDLMLTAVGPQSRNRRLGAELAKGVGLEAALASLGGQVAEGVSTTAAALALAASVGVELPITEAVSSLLKGEDPRAAVDSLMRRGLKEE